MSDSGSLLEMATAGSEVLSFADGGDPRDVLSSEMPWETYMNARLITERDLQLIRRYDKRAKAEQNTCLEEEGSEYAHTFLNVLRNVTKEDTVQYVLALIEEMLSEDATRAKLFHGPVPGNEPAGAGPARDPYSPVLKLLDKRSWFMQETASRVLVRILAARPPATEVVDDRQRPLDSSHASSSASDACSSAGLINQVTSSFIDWICAQLREGGAGSRGGRAALWALARLLQDRAARPLLHLKQGLPLLVPLLSAAAMPSNIQALYEASFCMWLMSFHCEAAHWMSSAQSGVVGALVTLAHKGAKEKVVRMAILTLKNLLSLDGAEATVGAELVEAGMVRVVHGLQQRQWADEELVEGLQALEEALQRALRQASSFDNYRRQVLSGTLVWGPMHTAPDFWRENIAAFEHDNYQVLRVLLKLMEVSKEPRTLAVACHDLGQFLQFHPHGKYIVQDLRGKELAMQLMAHGDPEVQKQSLLCVQKLMVGNWQFLQKEST